MMLSKKGNPIGYPRKNILRIIGANVLVAVFLFSCNFVTNNLPQAAKPAPAMPDLTWMKTESPLFPSIWPPTADTVWVRYTFAYGSNPANLADGTYVSAPLSKTEMKAGGSPTTTVLNNEMTKAGTQGVMPLDNQALEILKTEKRVSASCLGLTELPDPNNPATQEILAYYQAWFKYNGAFLDLVRANHAGFIDWVNQGK
jgi:hypothetical protein